VRVLPFVLAFAAAGGLAGAQDRTGDEFASAIASGNILAVRALVEDGADPDTPIVSGEHSTTPLVKAAERGKRDIVRYLLSKGAKVNARATGGDTALLAAVKGGYDDVITLLLTSGADVKARDEQGNTAFSLASFGAHLEIADILIAHGAPVDEPSSYGITPLLGAAGMGNEEVVRYLVSKGAKVNTVRQLEYGGTTPLTSAARGGQAGTVRALLELGADPRLKMKSGATALSNAEESGNAEVIALIKAALAKAPASKPAPARKP
jgi:ankyrin repeat protein